MLMWISFQNVVTMTTDRFRHRFRV